MQMCNVCCEDYSVKDEFVCPKESCGFKCCKNCLKHYIITNSNDNIECLCMNCKSSFSAFQTFDRVWMTEKYIPYIKEKLYNKKKKDILEIKIKFQKKS